MTCPWPWWRDRPLRRGPDQPRPVWARAGRRNAEAARAEPVRTLGGDAGFRSVEHGDRVGVPTGADGQVGAAVVVEVAERDARSEGVGRVARSGHPGGALSEVLVIAGRAGLLGDQPGLAAVEDMDRAATAVVAEFADRQFGQTVTVDVAGDRAAAAGGGGRRVRPERTRGSGPRRQQRPARGCPIAKGEMSSSGQRMAPTVGRPVDP